MLALDSWMQRSLFSYTFIHDLFFANTSKLGQPWVLKEILEYLGEEDTSTLCKLTEELGGSVMKSRCHGAILEEYGTDFQAVIVGNYPLKFNPHVQNYIKHLYHEHNVSVVVLEDKADEQPFSMSETFGVDPNFGLRPAYQSKLSHLHRDSSGTKSICHVLPFTPDYMGGTFGHFVHSHCYPNKSTSFGKTPKDAPRKAAALARNRKRRRKVS